MTSGSIYAGVLLKSDEVQLVFGQTVDANVVTLRNPVPRFRSYQEGLFDRRHRITRENRDAVLRAIGQHIASVPGPVRRIGCGSYGPLHSVSLEDRDALLFENIDRQEALERNLVYGKIRQTSTHQALKELRVYHTLREGLERSQIEVVVHTDVTCGALAEAYGRSIRRPGVRLHGPHDVLVFLHIAEGVGGAYVVGTDPGRSALHPEMGYQSGVVVGGDKWGEDLAKARKGASQPVFIQDLVSLKALLQRWTDDRGKIAGDSARSLNELPKKYWKEVPDYIAQLCASAVVMLAPHQIVLHGPVVHSAPERLLKDVRARLRNWLDVEAVGPIVSYREMLDDRYAFIDRPLDLGLEPDERGAPRHEPMLKGALLLAAQADFRRRPDSDAEIREFKSRPRS